MAEKKESAYFMYFPGNYRWSAAFVNMLGSMGFIACYIGAFFTIPLGLYVQAGLIGRYLHREHAKEHGLLP